MARSRKGKTLGDRFAWSINFFYATFLRADVADTPAAPPAPAAPAPKGPNRAVSILLLLFVTIGAGYFLATGSLELLTGDRIKGIGIFSLGLGWFLFFSWILRIQLKPRPA